MSDQGHPPQRPGLTRRDFVSTAAGAAGFMIVPRRVLGRGVQAPSDTANVAIVGIGGMGASNAQNLMSHNIVAICDVDNTLLENKLKQWRDRVYPAAAPAAARPAASAPAAPVSAYRSFGPSKAQQAANAKWAAPDPSATLKRFVDEQMPKVAKYRDYREMLDKQKDIDGVVVATPDHMHAIIASASMSAGKHVYVQKPLCWSVHECRHLVKQAAANPKLVTQMGNQGHSQDDARRGQEYIRGGALGDVTEVHVWTNRPLGYWPQGVPRPAAMRGDASKLSWNNNGVNQRLAAAMGQYPVPDGLAWDLFLGVAPEVEYHPIYHPFNWRGWVDWGQGALGDMGAHLVDHPVWALDLGLPTSIETIATPFNGDTYPAATMTYYEFAPRQGKPAVKMVWYDGGLMPPRPEELGDERVDPAGGILYIGTKGKMVQETYGQKPRLLPAERHNSYGPPKETMDRVPHESHELNWVNAIRGRDTISCPFSYAAHLNEIMLLGVASLRAKTKLHYDGARMEVTNSPAAGQFLTRAYRRGYSL
ncbi:MAG: Gfo/Idh/MocA family oxidoreductase [Acidobacteria bacterium]|nr:Gfo/Idh/MocA family oxidoreductase [Acidobacteriota bacterium]